MEEVKNPLSVAASDLDNKTEGIVNELVQTDDAQKIQDLTALFNINNTKKNALRVMKLGQLWDHTTEELLKRVVDRPDLASNDDLVKFISLAESGIEKASKTLGNVDVSPIIQINQQNNTVNIDGSTKTLSRDDRLKVLDAVHSILARIQTNNNTEIVDATVTVVEEDNNGTNEN